MVLVKRYVKGRNFCSVHIFFIVLDYDRFSVVKPYATTIYTMLRILCIVIFESSLPTNTHRRNNDISTSPQRHDVV